jgi:hypothetical protein
MRQFWTATVLFVAGIVILLEARKLPFGTVATPGPGFFPFVLAAGFSLTMLALVVQSFRRPDAEGAPALMLRERRPQLVAAMVALFGYAFALETAGFVLTTFLLVLVLFRVVEPRQWPVAIGGAAASAVLGHVLFKVWLGVRLPPGPWGF